MDSTEASVTSLLIIGLWVYLARYLALLMAVQVCTVQVCTGLHLSRFASTLEALPAWSWRTGCPGMRRGHSQFDVCEVGVETVVEK